MSRWLGVIAGAALALAIGEAAVRRVYWRPSTFDPLLGVVPLAGETLRFATEGDGRSRWSEGGVRRASPPDPERPSILALGDSFTEALMIDDEDVFTHRLERALREQGLDLPVLNVGASGNSAAHYVALAGHWKQRFRVRWTLVAMLPNDVAEDAFDPAKTHFRRAPGGALEVVRAEPRRAWPWLAPLRRRSALVNYGLMRVNEFAAAARSEPALFGGADAHAPPPSPAPASFPVEEVLAALGRAYDERLTLLVLSPFESEQPPERETRILNACRARGWSCLSLRDRFPPFRARHEAPYGFSNSAWGSGHLNAAGHHAAAELLAEELARLRALDLL